MTQAPTVEAAPAQGPAKAENSNVVAQVFEALKQVSALGLLGDKGPKIAGIIALAEVANPFIVQATQKTVQQHIQDNILTKYGRERVARVLQEKVASNMPEGARNFFTDVAEKIIGLVEKTPGIKAAYDAANAVAGHGITGGQTVTASSRANETPVAKTTTKTSPQI